MVWTLFLVGEELYGLDGGVIMSYGDWVEIDTVSDLKPQVTMERFISIGESI